MTKDDFGPFHCSGTGYPQYYGASFRSVAAMFNMAAWIANPELRGTAAEGAKFAVECVDALIAELKK